MSFFGSRVGQVGIWAAGRRMGLSLEPWATAVLRNGLGRCQEAFGAASEALEQYPTEPWFSPWATVEPMRPRAASAKRRRDRRRNAWPRARQPVVPTGPTSGSRRLTWRRK